jgi:hypothetical protein
MYVSIGKQICECFAYSLVRAREIITDTHIEVIIV